MSRTRVSPVRRWSVLVVTVAAATTSGLLAPAGPASADGRADRAGTRAVAATSGPHALSGRSHRVESHRGKSHRVLSHRVRSQRDRSQGHGTGGREPAHEVRTVALPRVAKLPSSVDLSAWSMPVQNQGQVGSCVAWSIGYAMMGWYYRHAFGQAVEFAPMYLYSQAHVSQTDGGGGMLATKALEMLKAQGIDTRQDYGAGWALDWVHPPGQGSQQWQNASHYRISGYHTLFAHHSSRGASASQQAQIKAALAGSAPVAIAINLEPGFSRYHRGVFHGHRRVNRERKSLHEMLAVGYSRKGLVAQNSWGTGWGRKGFVTLGWDVVRRDVYEADVIDGLVTSLPTTDTVAPTVSAPVSQVHAGTTTSGLGIPVTLSWQGSDDSGSVAGYRLSASVDGGAWQPQTLGAQDATSVAFSLEPGRTYRFAVQAVDAAGNASGWAAGPPLAVGDYDDTSGYVQYSTGWSRIAWDAADGGTLTTSSTTGAWASFSFTGSSVAWVAAQGANRGQANVYLDGAYATTVDLYASSPVARYVAVHGNWAADQTHTLTIQVVGTAGRPAVDVDSFVVLS